MTDLSSCYTALGRKKVVASQNFKRTVLLISAKDKPHAEAVIWLSSPTWSFSSPYFTVSPAALLPCIVLHPAV